MKRGEEGREEEGSGRRSEEGRGGEVVRGVVEGSAGEGVKRREGRVW
jgi:hypothetical protein